MSHLAKSKKTTVYAITESDQDGNTTVNWAVEFNPKLQLLSVRAQNVKTDAEISFDISEAAARNLGQALFGIIDEVCQARILE